MRTLNRELVRIIALPETRKAFVELGIEPVGTSPKISANTCAPRLRAGATSCARTTFAASDDGMGIVGYNE